MLPDKAAFLTCDDSETSIVDVPEWPMWPQVKVRSLTGEQQERWYARRTALKENGVPCPGGLDALACCMGILGDGGAVFFTEADAPALGKKHPEILSRIAGRIYYLSAMTTESRAEIEKKRNQTETSDSGISSPEPLPTHATSTDSSAP